MNRNRFNKDRIIIPSIIILFVLLIIVSVDVDNRGHSNQGILKDFVMFIEKVVMYPINVFNKSDDINQVDSKIIKDNINSAIEQDNQELRDVLDLNKTLTEFTPINATVLSRNKSYWFNNITIDKGSNNGIKKNMAVITKNGLIGKISNVSRNSSEIKLITSNDINFKVSIAIKTNNVDSYAILNGYNKKTGLIKATGIDKMTQINQGDVVVTSGLGEMFPSGVYIGKVEKIENDKYNLSKTIYIKTDQDFNSFHYVTVLKVKWWYHLLY